jgi:hypothetical protein
MERLGLVVFQLGSATDKIKQGINAACQDSCNKGSSVQSIFGDIANILIFVVGAVSVIAIILGGLRYVTSQGDSKQTGQAKDTILYAVIGLIAAIAAYAIVNFVVSQVN